MENFASNLSFCMILVYLCDANHKSFSDLAPVTTILPDAKMMVVVLGLWIHMMTAAKCYAMTNEGSPTFTQYTENEIPTLGLYSAFWAGSAIIFNNLS